MALELINTDNVSSLLGARGLSTLVIGDTTYLFERGDDDVHVFSLDPDGRLTHVTQVVDSPFLYLRSGDNKRAEAALRQVVEDGQDASAVLNAARQLIDVYEKAGDQRALASALEAIAKNETAPCSGFSQERPNSMRSGSPAKARSRPSASHTATSPVCTDSTRPLRTTWTRSAGPVMGAEA